MRESSTTRLNLAVARVAETGLPLVYVNQVGGQDELVFDGGSFVVDRDGRLAVSSPFWRSMTQTVTWAACERPAGRAGPAPSRRCSPRLEDIYQALMLGLRDYVRQERFPGVLLGLSGGIDSALTAAVAVDALGAGPGAGRAAALAASPATRAMDDAAASRRRLGIQLDTVPIDRRHGRR